MLLHFINKKSECTGCGACAAICPQNCISFKYDDEGFSYPIVDTNCINCDKCYRVCPVINMNKESSSTFKQFCVASRHLDDNIWEKSSSGGAFSAICEAYCVDGDGIFGAKFAGHRVVHDCVYSINDIACFRKSKYIQSDMKGSYDKIKDILENNRKVLFSGTPCQVAGVRKFLGKEYENLLCIDLVCHGVGSPGVFEKYIHYLENKYGSKIKSFVFRNKKVRMGRLLEYIVTIELENGTKIEDKSNLYNNGFLQALFLRPSCAECKFTNLNRVGDITIADFKKKHELLPRVKGLDNFSTIIVNTKKGTKVFEKLKGLMEMYPIKKDDVVRTNSPLRLPSKMSCNRETFFSDLRRGESIEHVIARYITLPGLLNRMWLLIPDRMRVRIKRSIRWIRK